MTDVETYNNTSQSKNVINLSKSQKKQLFKTRYRIHLTFQYGYIIEIRLFPKPSLF